MYMNFKVFIVNVLFCTVFFTIFFPLEFSSDPSRIELIGYFVLSFHVYLLIIIIINIVLLVISFLTDDIVNKLTSRSHFLIEMIVRFCILVFAPLIFSLMYTKEANSIILMAVITIFSYVLLKTFFSGRITRYGAEKIIHNVFYYSLVMLIALFVLATLMIGFIYH